MKSIDCEKSAAEKAAAEKSAAEKAAAEKTAADKPADQGAPAAAPDKRPAPAARPARRRKRSIAMPMFVRLVGRCLALQFVYLVALVASMLIGRLVCGSMIWYGTEPLYWLLHWVNNNPLFAVGSLFVLGSLGIVIVVWYNALRRFDDVAAAAEGIVTARDEPVSLPDDLSQIEARLNAARLHALEAERVAKAEAQRKNDLLVYLAHDLKTPLTSVIGYLRLLHDEQDISPELRQRYEGVALDRAERLEDLVNEFFEVARLNLSEASLVCSDVNLTRMVEQELFEYMPVMEPKGLTYDLEAEPDVTVGCDVGKIERVLDNLLRNAVNYSHAGTKIEVGLKACARDGVDGAELRVANHGDTIATAQLERLFEQFYRLSSSRDADTGGAGLGLAISRGLVQAHGGSIHAESSDGMVTFVVWLPRKPDLK